jgi:hypothetical protein
MTSTKMRIRFILFYLATLTPIGCESGSVDGESGGGESNVERAAVTGGHEILVGRWRAIDDVVIDIMPDGRLVTSLGAVGRWMPREGDRVEFIFPAKRTLYEFEKTSGGLDLSDQSTNQHSPVALVAKLSDGGNMCIACNGAGGSACGYCGGAGVRFDQATQRNVLCVVCGNRGTAPCAVCQGAGEY